MLNIVDTCEVSIDALEQTVHTGEALIAQIRATQTEAFARLAQARVTRIDGSRTMGDWVAAKFDVTADTAKALVDAARLFTAHPETAEPASSGAVTFDRALATARLVAAGASKDTIAASAGYDLAGVARLTARHRRITRAGERRSFRDRYLVIQPSLDDATWRLQGSLPAIEGSIVETALNSRADALRDPAIPAWASQRRADALVAIAQDTLDGGDNGSDSAAGSGPVVSVFVDANLAGPTNGEAGAEIPAGPRVGSETLERLLCEGSVQVIALDGLKPVAASSTTKAIPPAIRRAVIHRDGGCAIAGCSSRYRLQVHHIIPRSQGGTHDPKNLATLCWYHHHVAIHGTGYRLDPDSPPQRRRLLPPIRAPDPSR